MGIISYTDIATESIEVIKKKRKRINLMVFFCLIPFASFYLFGWIFANSDIGLAIICFILSTIIIVLMVGLVIKKEIWSVMIYLRGKE